MHYFAHSARPDRGVGPQPYEEHVRSVVSEATSMAEEAVKHAAVPMPEFVRAVGAGAKFHDLGKLDLAKQLILRTSSRAKLPGIRHEEAGIAHLLERGDILAALLAASHHQGLGALAEARKKASASLPALGRWSPDVDRVLSDHLGEWVGIHRALLGNDDSTNGAASGIGGDTLAARLALSCLVDADHSDAAAHDTGAQARAKAATRWSERAASLRRYAGEKPRETDRDRRRHRFFTALDNQGSLGSIECCSAPVGSGKTLAVMAHMLKLAETLRLRHIIVVLPYTNIITQSAQEYRQSIVLDGETSEDVIAELHHLVDVSSKELREYGSLWRTPVIVTTAVGFFETLASNHPSALRRLHELPGSAIFLDEAHAALPAHLWPLAWQWLSRLADNWGVRIILGSGTLFQFWKEPSFPIEEQYRREVPEITPRKLRSALEAAERERLPPRLIDPLTIDQLVVRLSEESRSTVAVLNTVRNASEVARRLANAPCPGALRSIREARVLHLSTALAPADRVPIIAEVKRRLIEEPDRSWTLIATSCVEAGLDFSFRTGYRESSSVAGLLQLGGRVRRNNEDWTGTLISFRLTGPDVTPHPAMKETAKILDELLAEGAFRSTGPSGLLSLEFQRALKGKLVERAEKLKRMDKDSDFPGVRKEFRVIDADTRMIIVEPSLAVQMERGDRVSFPEVTLHSVQVYASKISKLPCRELLRRGRGEAGAASPISDGANKIFIWEGEYDPGFLGYMAAEQAIRNLYAAGGAII